MSDLQDAVALVFPPGEYLDLSSKDRKSLARIRIKPGVVGEGDYVELRGYLSGDGKRRPGPSGDESVNCDGADGADYHIPVTEAQGEDEHRAVVAEMIPQSRQAEWTPKKLMKIFSEGLRVRIRGQLFFDKGHKVNGDPGHDIGGQPKRCSLWEVHPITSFDVCSATQCDPQAEGGWTPLEDWR